MAAITDLASASSVASTDYFVVNQSGTDRKAQANKIPLFDTANTFTAAQTYSDEINVRQHTSNNAWSIDIANGATVVAANGAVFQFSTTVVFSGLVIVANATDGQVAMFLCGGGNVVEIADGGNVYSKTKDTATSSNLYYDAGTGEYRLQNNTGGSRTYSIFTVRMRAGS